MPAGHADRVDQEVLEHARRQAAVLLSVGLPRAAAETEAAYPYFSGPNRPEHHHDEDDSS